MPLARPTRQGVGDPSCSPLANSLPRRVARLCWAPATPDQAGHRAPTVQGSVPRLVGSLTRCVVSPAWDPLLQTYHRPAFVGCRGEGLLALVRMRHREAMQWGHGERLTTAASTLKVGTSYLRRALVASCADARPWPCARAGRRRREKGPNKLIRRATIKMISDFQLGAGGAICVGTYCPAVARQTARQARGQAIVLCAMPEGPSMNPINPMPCRQLRGDHSNRRRGDGACWLDRLVSRQSSSPTSNGEAIAYRPGIDLPPIYFTSVPAPGARIRGLDYGIQYGCRGGGVTASAGPSLHGCAILLPSPQYRSVPRKTKVV